MFNGTKTRPPGEFDRIMEANGGSNNAYTSSDVTVYQNWFPRSAMPLVFDLESDRMRNLDFDPRKVESERGVVYSERRSSIDNDNFGTLVEQMQATAFVAHPYQIPDHRLAVGHRGLEDRRPACVLPAVLRAEQRRHVRRRRRRSGRGLRSSPTSTWRAFPRSPRPRR